MTITIYTFRDKDNNEVGSFYTQNYQEAKEYGATTRSKVIANEYEWCDSFIVNDFTEPMDDQNEEETD